MRNWLKDVFPVCAVTRAQGLKKKDLELGDSVFGEALAEDVWPSSGELGDSTEGCVQKKLVVPEFADVQLPLTRQALISAQQSDSSLASCFAAVRSDAGVSGGRQSFLMEEGVLMRTWVARPGTGKLKTSEDWNTVHQIVLPVVCRYLHK